MEQKTIGKSKEDYLKTVLIVLKEHGFIVGFNSALIGMGLTGVIAPSTSAEYYLACGR